MKAVVIDEHGDADVMHYRSIEMPAQSQPRIMGKGVVTAGMPRLVRMS